jgi:hypothetical protein
MKPFDPTKPVQTRDGRKARIVCMDANTVEYPIIALLAGPAGVEYPISFALNGKFYTNREHPNDLINIPIKHKREVWVNCYKADFGDFYHSKDIADSRALPGRIACIKLNIEFEEGEGL